MIVSPPDDLQEKLWNLMRVFGHRRAMARCGVTELSLTRVLNGIGVREKTLRKIAAGVERLEGDARRVGDDVVAVASQKCGCGPWLRRHDAGCPVGAAQRAARA